MPMIPAQDLPNQGQDLKPGDVVELTVKSVENGQVEFAYPSEEQPVMPGMPEDKMPMQGPEVPTEEAASKMNASDLRKKLPIKPEDK